MSYQMFLVLYTVIGLSTNAIAGSSPGDVVGKLTVGYQGWFAAKGDGSPHNHWVHWSGDTPTKGHQTFELWPDVREYTHTYQTGYANLGNGEPAKLFSSFDDQVVDTHFKWMEQNGIDVAALQRFGGGLKDIPNKNQLDGIALKVMHSAQTHSRKFYIMYDISGWNTFHNEIKEDWNNTIVGKLHLTSSPAYAKQNGKPVVCIWGFGFTDRPGNAADALDVINHFKSIGVYVIGGVPAKWRTGKEDSKPDFINVYTALNMLSPWSVGRFKGVDGAKNYNDELAADHTFCDTHNVDYQPVLFAGFAWSNWNGGQRNMIPRLHGDFMWQQFVNLRTIGITNAYVAMFDEYDEGTAIAKAAESSAMIPTDQYFLTLDADGVHVSSDFYLRLVGDGAKMMKGLIPNQPTHPTKHVL